METGPREAVTHTPLQAVILQAEDYPAVTGTGTSVTEQSWGYDDIDPGLRLFTAALAAGAPMRFEPGMRILEIGCDESDWLTRAAAVWPLSDFIGIDTRATVCATRLNCTTLRADAMRAGLFENEEFDGIVSISSIEHIGLGHYGDPVDPEGDWKIVTNCGRWLKPGGWLYWDVPYSPVGYRVVGTEYRMYDTRALLSRHVYPLRQAWGGSAWMVYARKEDAGTLIERPTTQTDPERFEFYIALCWVKE